MVCRKLILTADPTDGNTSKQECKQSCPLASVLVKQRPFSIASGALFDANVSKRASSPLSTLQTYVNVGDYLTVYNTMASRLQTFSAVDVAWWKAFVSVISQHAMLKYFKVFLGNLFMVPQQVA